MECINRSLEMNLLADAMIRKIVEQPKNEKVAFVPPHESRAERRARERAEIKAQIRAAKAATKKTEVA